MTYQWKIPKFQVSAQDAGDELERIGAERGAITPESVLEESRNASAVLHGCFEWDNDTAAEQYRKQQAHDIIRNIVTVSVHGKQTSEPVRAFISIQGEYKPMEQVVVTQEYKDEMMDAAMKELQCFRSKYQALTQLQSVFAAIDGLKPNA